MMMRRLAWIACASLWLGACDGGGEETTAADASTSTTGADTSSSGEDSMSNGTTTAPSTTESMTTEVASSSGETTTSDTASGSSSTGAADSSTTQEGPAVVVMQTSLGDITLEFFPEQAPITVENFFAYVESGFYDGSDGQAPTIFHRVIPGFVIQGGGLSADLESKATMPPIVNEHDSSGLLNDRGTLSMARTNDPNSATSQFFVNLVDNAGLDMSPGYAVFAQVVEGMEVVDAIAAVETTTMGPYDDVPVDPIVIMSVTLQ